MIFGGVVDLAGGAVLVADLDRARPA